VKKHKSNLAAANLMWAFFAAGSVSIFTTMEGCVPTTEQSDLLASRSVCVRQQSGACMASESELDYTAHATDVVSFGVPAANVPAGTTISGVTYSWGLTNSLACAEAGTNSDHCTITVPQSTSKKTYKVSLTITATATTNGVSTNVTQAINSYDLVVPVALDTFTASTDFRYCDTSRATVVNVTEPTGFVSNPTTPYPAVVFFRGTGGGDVSVISKLKSNGFYVIDVVYDRQADQIKNKYLEFNEGACAVRWVRAHTAWNSNGTLITNPTNVRNTGKSLQIHPGKIFTVGYSQGGAISSHLGMVKRTSGVPVAWNNGIKNAIDNASNKPDWAPVDGEENLAINSTWSSFSSNVQGSVIVASASDFPTFFSNCGFPSIPIKPDLDAHLFATTVTFIPSQTNQLTTYTCYDSNPANRPPASAFDGFEGVGGWNYALGEENGDAHKVWSAMSWLASSARDTSYKPPVMIVTGENDPLIPFTESIVEGRYLRSLGRTVKSVASDGYHASPFTGGSTLIVVQFINAIIYGNENPSQYDVTDPVGYENAFKARYSVTSSNSLLCPDDYQQIHNKLYCDI